MASSRLHLREQPCQPNVRDVVGRIERSDAPVLFELAGCSSQGSSFRSTRDRSGRKTRTSSSPTGDQDLSDEQPDEGKQDSKGGVKQIGGHVTFSAVFFSLGKEARILGSCSVDSPSDLVGRSR
jgi:hypothetical protein